VFEKGKHSTEDPSALVGSEALAAGKKESWFPSLPNKEERVAWEFFARRDTRLASPFLEGGCRRRV
jgi:hypothetical protein